jgi:hypothetical protein
MTKQKQDNKTFSVTLYGFKTREAALRFVNWYEKQGEQWYYDHLEILDNDNLYKEGCNIDVTRTGNNGSYYDVTPSGVDAGESIILTFSSDFTNVTNIVHTDIDFAEGNSSNCSTATFTEKTLGSSASGTTWSADGDTATTVTITSGTNTVTAGRCVRIRIGTNAVSQATGVNQISNGDADDDDTVSISGTFGDTGTITIDIITDDQVSVSATVSQSISFSISDNTIGFGSLSSSGPRFATGDATGSGTDSAEAHNLQVGTNASSGYTVTYNGSTLTSGLNTISVASITNDADGTSGTEQFAIGASTNGDATIATGYDHNAVAGNRDWNFVADTTTTLVSETVPTATETVSMFYLANISTLTEAGSYATSITYNATANF